MRNAAALFAFIAATAACAHRAGDRVGPLYGAPLYAMHAMHAASFPRYAALPAPHPEHDPPVYAALPASAHPSSASPLIGTAAAAAASILPMLL